LCLIAVVLFTPGRVEADVWDQAIEVIVDGITGDINPFVQRYASDGTTLLHDAGGLNASESHEQC
jgi:hypothetical protein